jgi:hypothetical protein
MDRSAIKYFTIASIFGMHSVRTQSRLREALYLCYNFVIFALFTSFNLYVIRDQYLYISKFAESEGSGGLITVYFFILIYHITLSVQLLVSFYWLLTKSQDFSKLIKQVDYFADELSCIFSFFVSPALCALVITEIFTYDQFDNLIFQSLETCYGCAAVAIWQWKIILVASSMRIVTSKLNANLKVPICFMSIVNCNLSSNFFSDHAFASSFGFSRTHNYTTRQSC